MRGFETWEKVRPWQCWHEMQNDFEFATVHAYSKFQYFLVLSHKCTNF
jgi:hypothetical protein